MSTKRLCGNSSVWERTTPDDILIHAGEGILAVPISRQEEFFRLLVAFYETNIPDELITFLAAYCIEKPSLGK